MFFQDSDLPSYVTVGRDLHNGANFRRAQIGVEGRVYRDFNYEFVFDFGSSGTERAGQIYLLRVAYTGRLTTRTALRFVVASLSPRSLRTRLLRREAAHGSQQ